jgi:ABC-type multidrug transport system fused ATPase/permease subunit
MLLMFGGWIVWWSGTLTLAADILGNASTQCMKFFIASLKKNGSERYWFAAALFGISLARKVVLNRSLQLISTCAYMFRAGIMGRCYSKLLTSANAVCSLGSGFNRLAVDSNRIAVLVIFGHLLWSCPLRISLSLYTAYQMVGIPALVGIAFVMAVLASLFILARQMRRVRRELAQLSDARIQLTAEVLRALRTVKSLALEDHFEDKIEQVRAAELGGIRRLNSLFAMSASLNFWAPMCATTLTVVSAVILGVPLEAGQIFATARTFQQLMVPLWMLPTMVNRVIAASISADRIDQILRSGSDKEIDHTERDTSQALDLRSEKKSKEEEEGQGSKGVSLMLKDAEFPDMKPINLCFTSPSLVAVVGNIGSGKSTFLTHLAGLTSTVSGTFTHPDSIGYCSYPAWLHTGTVMENILFGRPLDEAWYQQVVSAVALQEELLYGQSVGEAGALLSGGQRQRVALARALYGRPRLLLVDNILASLDAKVAAHVYNNCFSPNGIMADSIRIVVMSEAVFIRQSNVVIHMSGGNVESIGLPNEEESDEMEDAEMRKEPVEDQMLLSPKKDFDQTMEEDISHSCHSPVLKLVWRLIKAVGGPVPVAILFVAVFSGDYLRLRRDMYLKGRLDGPPSAEGIRVFIIFFSSLSAMQGILTLLANLLAVWLCWRASRATHRNAVHRILHAKLPVLSQIPTGRLLNRLGRDLETLDYVFPEKLVSVMGSFSGILCTCLAIAQLFPRLLVTLVLPIMAVTILQRRFARAWRTMLRLSGVAMAPLSALLTETLIGLPTIRVFHQTTAFLRQFYTRCDAYHMASFLSASTRRWVSLRTEVVASLYLGIIAGFCCVGGVDAGTAAVLILYALQAAEGIDWFVKHVAEIDHSLVAVERIGVYAETLPQEEAESYDKVGNVALHIDFENVSVFFDGRLALKNISFNVRSGEKVAIVGRTGAGKSSLVATLLRLCDYTGVVRINGTPTGSLLGLRSLVATVTQEAMLFESASLRANLDPHGRHSDSELWSVLDFVKVGATIRQLPDMLDGVVSGLSTGQCQLLCVARAALSTSGLVVLDEATSALDPAADVSLHRTLLEKFADRTVLTVAHRLDVCALYDRVVVLSEGRIVEDGRPTELLSRGGPYAQLHQYK